MTNSKIYQNQALVGIIHNSFFKTSTAFGYKYQKYFTSSHLTQKELELPMPLVALAATGVSFASYIQNNIQIFSSYMLLLVHGRQVSINGSILMVTILEPHMSDTLDIFRL